MQVEGMNLADRWSKLKEEKPQLRIRNAAAELEVTEVELLATRCGQDVMRLTPDFKAIFEEIESLGKVMALSRNESVVHERKGVYLNPSFGPHASLFVGEDIDLRMFMQCWDTVFAVTDQSVRGTRKSIQFFAKDGEAVHKIYLVNDSNEEAYNELIKKFKSPDQSPAQNVEPKAAKPEEKPDQDIDVEGFQQGWINLKDTHAFFGLTRKYGVSRPQALRLAPKGDYAVKVSNTASREILQKAAETQVPIMVFVGNQGMIQIHTGPVKKLLEHGTWYNVMDPMFNLHLNEADIAESWVVRKPTEDGTVSSLEVFDKNGELIVTFFGKRKPGIPELTDWRTILAELN